MVPSRDLIDWRQSGPSEADRRAVANADGRAENHFEQSTGPIDLRAYLATRPEGRFAVLSDRPYSPSPEKGDPNIAASSPHAPRWYPRQSMTVPGAGRRRSSSNNGAPHHDEPEHKFDLLDDSALSDFFGGDDDNGTRGDNNSAGLSLDGSAFSPGSGGGFGDRRAHADGVDGDGDDDDDDDDRHHSDSVSDIPDSVFESSSDDEGGESDSSSSSSSSSSDSRGYEDVVNVDTGRPGPRPAAAAPTRNLAEAVQQQLPAPITNVDGDDAAAAASSDDSSDDEPNGITEDQLAMLYVRAVRFACSAFVAVVCNAPANLVLLNQR